MFVCLPFFKSAKHYRNSKASKYRKETYRIALQKQTWVYLVHQGDQSHSDSEMRAPVLPEYAPCRSCPERFYRIELCVSTQRKLVPGTGLQQWGWNPVNVQYVAQHGSIVTS